MEKQLVSVVVATYNSAPHVIETLESAKAQTWQNLELIVSDDYSADNTVEICREWIDKNKNRFTRTELITVPKNTGVSANCNRCIAASHAEWIKMIAGDDILLPGCIEDNMQFVEKNAGADIIFSQVQLYLNNFSHENFLTNDPSIYPMHIMNPAYGSEDQYKLLLLSDRITFTPSFFFKKQAILAVGGYDAENNLVEDYPMWLKLTNTGTRLYYFHQPTVGYRRHEKAANNIADKVLFKPMFLKTEQLRKKFVYPNLPWDLAGAKRYEYKMATIFKAVGLIRQSSFSSALYKIATVFFNPYKYISYLKKQLFNLKQTDLFYKD